MSDEVYPVDSPETAESIPQRTGFRFFLKKIFVGPPGLRAGWKDLLFILVIFVIGFCLRPLGKLTGKIDPKLPAPPGPMLFLESLRAVAVLVATAIMARFIDRKPWGYFGMPFVVLLIGSMFVVQPDLVPSRGPIGLVCRNITIPPKTPIASTNVSASANLACCEVMRPTVCGQYCCSLHSSCTRL